MAKAKTRYALVIDGEPARRGRNLGFRVALGWQYDFRQNFRGHGSGERALLVQGRTRRSRPGQVVCARYRRGACLGFRATGAAVFACGARRGSQGGFHHSEPLEECRIGGTAEGDYANRQVPAGLYSLSVTFRQLWPPCRSGAVRELEA